MAIVADQPPPAVVETLEVRAARLAPVVGDAAFSVIQLPQRVLETNERLDQALAQTPGLSLFRRTSSLGANPTTQGVSLRGIAGSGASRALVTLDGVPQNDPFGGWVIWNGLSSEAIEGARVVRGAGAGPYGAGALTGTIALDEKSSDGLVANATMGEMEYRRAAIAAGTEVDGVGVFVSAAGEKSDGWTPVRERRGAADVPLALDNWSAAARLSAEVGGGAVAAVRVSSFQERRSAGLVGANSTARGSSASFTLARPNVGDSLGWRVQLWGRTSNLDNTSAAVAAGRVGTTPANNQFDTPASGVGFNAALRWVSGTNSWEIGSDLRFNEGTTNELFRYMNGAFTRVRQAGGRTFVGGLYAEGTHQMGQTLLTAGVRVDRWRTYDAKRTERDATLLSRPFTLNAPPADRDGVLPTGRIGIKTPLGSSIQARAGAYAGFRPATLNELHRPFRVGNDVTEANAGLKPERLYGAEAGLDGQFTGGRWSVTGFYNRLQDAIANVTVGGPGTYPVAGLIPAGGVLRQRQNAGRVNAYGVEADAGYKLTETFELNAALAYTRAKVDGGSAAPQLTGLRPAQTPRLTATASANWRPLQKLAVYADVRYESSRFDDDQNLRKLKEGVVFDARLTWDFNPTVSAFVAADNVFNTRLQTGRTGDGVISYGQPRLARVGIALKL
jgi:outer membrane receptor protein involved in Fe transport